MYVRTCLLCCCLVLVITAVDVQLLRWLASNGYPLFLPMRVYHLETPLAKTYVYLAAGLGVPLALFTVGAVTGCLYQLCVHAPRKAHTA